MGTPATPETQLDLQVTYLRHVHHFCFYSALWCDDEWDLHRRCGAVVVRDILADGEVMDPKREQEEADWLQDRDDCLKLFRAPCFVHKHLSKAHPSFCDEVIRSTQMQTARASYLADKNRPIGLVTKV